MKRNGITFLQAFTLFLLYFHARGIELWGSVPSLFACFIPFILEQVARIIEAIGTLLGWKDRLNYWLWKLALKFNIWKKQGQAHKIMKDGLKKPATGNGGPAPAHYMEDQSGNRKRRKPL